MYSISKDVNQNRQSFRRGIAFGATPRHHLLGQNDVQKKYGNIYMSRFDVSVTKMHYLRV